MVIVVDQLVSVRTKRVPLVADFTPRFRQSVRKAHHTRCCRGGFGAPPNGGLIAQERLSVRPTCALELYSE